ncbi:hypothetical protein [Azospirillum sp. A39]|uniref:hypothetical protein n=1 Tax=Azospirillum sp. A39 TaxID=3462279 RepID=UPI0040453432
MDISALGSYPATRPTAPTPAAGSSTVAPSTAAGAGTGGGGETGPPGIYISPVLRYDQTAALAVLLFRDSDTGETKDQIPPERVVEQYRRAGGRPPEAVAGDTAGDPPASSGGGDPVPPATLPVPTAATAADGGHLSVTV